MELRKYGEFDRDVWITSDTHLGHFNIISYTNRVDKNRELFKSTWEMDTALICYWNELVKPDDIVFHLGDFSFQSDKYRDKLNGGKFYLIRGNHDKSKYDYLFDEVVDMAEIQIGEFNCLMSHQPIESGRIYKKGFNPDITITNGYDWVISGHVHQAYTVNGKNINVGVDVWNYRPIHIGRLANFLRMLKKG